MGLGQVPLQSYVQGLSSQLEDSNEAVDFFGEGTGEAPTRERGHLSQYYAKKGFGFIAPADGGPLVFAHRADSDGSLEKQELGAEVCAES